MALGVLPEANIDDEEDVAVFSEINITPLTDVFLVLLIIFMVTSSAIHNSGVKVNLPKSGAASSTSPNKGVTVTIDSKGGVFVGDEAATMDSLEMKIKEKLESQPDKAVILAGDQEVLLGLAIQVMNLAKKAGAEKFGIATKGKGQK